jgi:far upstream element-binding protein
VPKSGNADNPLIRTLQITHPEQQGALNAKEMVENVLKTKPGYQQQMRLLQQHQMPGQQQHQQPECVVQVMIPDNDVGLCIGRQGCVIKYMQNTTRTKIQIPPHVAQPGDLYRTATILGPSLEACHQVRQMIEKIIADQSSASIIAAVQQQQQQQQYEGAGGYAQHYQGQQHQPQYGAPQENQQGYSAEWAAYHAAVAAQQQQQSQQTAAAPMVHQQQDGYADWSQQQQQQHVHSAAGTASVTSVAPTATVAAASTEIGQQQPAADAYYEQFFRYAYYYGEEAARQYYGAWAPSVGTPNPYGVNPNIQPQPTASGQPPADPQPTTMTEAVVVAPSVMDTSVANDLSAEARETGRRLVSNLPAWMTKK